MRLTAEEVRAIRRKLGLAQVDLGDVIGVTERTIRRWEVGGSSKFGGVMLLDLERRHDEKEGI